MGRAAARQVSAVPDVPPPLPAEWVGEGTLVEVMRALAKHLLARGQLDLAETFIDATFAGAKKGAVRLIAEHTSGKGTKMA